MFKDLSLLGTFPVPPPIGYISSTPVDSVSADQASTSTGLRVAPPSLLAAPSPALDVSDPWVFPDPLSVDFMAESMPLTTVELEYQAIKMASEDANLLCPTERAYDPYVSPYWATVPPSWGDFMDSVLPSDEAILETMIGSDRPWEEMHHLSSFLPPQFKVASVSNSGSKNRSHVPSYFYAIATEGNMATIAETHPIDILTKPGHVGNILLGANCSPDEVKAYTALFKEF